MRDRYALLFCAYNRCRYHRLGSVLYCVFAFGPLHPRRKLAAKSHFINTATMNQRVESDIDDAHQKSQSTKAKMRGVLAEIATNQEEREQPLDTKVSIV